MIGIKLALLLAIFVAGAAGAALPLAKRAGFGQGRLLGWGNSFAAGVFLAAGLVHMLPDAEHGWVELGYDYPMAFAIATAAFLLMLLVEHVLLPEPAHEELHAPSGERFVRLAEKAAAGHERHDAVEVYAVLTALSIHSLLAGLALGAETELSGVVVMSTAIIAHKSAAGFALGVSLHRSALPRRQVGLLVALFALATPIGGVIGTVIGEALGGDVGARLEATLLSLAAGTFVYVATFDILRDEFFPAPGGRFAKWCVLVAGVAAMAALAIWV